MTKSSVFGIETDDIYVIFFELLRFITYMDPNPKAQLSDGNSLPLIGLGMLNFRANDKTFNLNDFIMKAANIGYTHFDVTNNENAIGDALKLVMDAKRQM